MQYECNSNVKIWNRLRSQALRNAFKSKILNIEEEGGAYEALDIMEMK